MQPRRFIQDHPWLRVFKIRAGHCARKATLDNVKQIDKMFLTLSKRILTFKSCVMIATKELPSPGRCESSAAWPSARLIALGRIDLREQAVAGTHVRC